MAAELYLDNLKLAQAFHPLIGILEVALRNALNERLANYLNDPDWIINQRNGGFMIDPSLRYRDRSGRWVTNDFLIKSVSTAEKSILKNNGMPTSGKIVSELMLGFWTSFFDTTHYKLLQGRPIQIFSSLPPGASRKTVWNLLNDIRGFRNRMNHNEPLCFNGAGFSCAEANKVYQDLFMLLDWLDTDIRNWVTHVDGVQNQIQLMINTY